MTERALAPAAALRGSLRLLRARPGAILSVATALLTSMFAVCCGMGVLAAPWFMCELFALQIGAATGATVARSSAWLAAGLVQMLAVLVLCSLAFLTLLGLGPDVLLGGAMEGSRTADARLIETLGLLFGAGGSAVALVVHFEYAPAILIDRGGSLAGALLESARLVDQSGPLRTWLTSVTAHGLQLAPPLAGLVLAISHGTLASTVWWSLLLLPLLALCVALGQGMVVTSYLALRERLVEPARVPKEVGRLSALIWFMLLVLVLLGPLLATGSLFKPARVGQGALPESAHVIRTLTITAEERELYLPDTALRLALSAQRVRVLASDGGGAGTLPLPPRKIERVRVARDRAPGLRSELAFAIEVQLQGGITLLSWIDDAGVRLDDSLSRRFAQRMPGLTALLLLACVLGAAIWIGVLLPRLARIRHALASGQQASNGAAFERASWRAVFWLSPAALGSLALGIRTLLG